MNAARPGSISASIATLEAPRSLVFRSETLEPDALLEGQLLCETLVTAISPGTELAAFLGAPALRPGVTYPRLVGYCNVARVIAVGPGTAGFRVGDRILSFSSHRSHFVIRAAEVLAVLSASIASEDAVFAYLYHLGYSAILKAGVCLGSTVVVLGLGVLGLGAVALSVLAGARVLALSDQPKARACALANGASICFQRNELAELRAALGEHRAHAVITTSNAWDDWRIALECAGFEASIAVLGFPGREAATVPLNPLDSAHFYTRQLRIVAAGMHPERRDSRGFQPFNERENLQRILDWISAGSLRPRQLICEELEGRDLGRAYDRIARRDGSPFTFLLRWAR
jgi:threonine dehydrogenase-like Zn-dependent dehydrogenase